MQKRTRGWLSVEAIAHKDGFAPAVIAQKNALESIKIKSITVQPFGDNQHEIIFVLDEKGLHGEGKEQQRKAMSMGLGKLMEAYGIQTASDGISGYQQVGVGQWGGMAEISSASVTNATKLAEDFQKMNVKVQR